MPNNRVMGRESQRPFGGREEEALRIVERVPRRRVETAVPHERGVKGDVQCLWASPLVVRAVSSRADNQVALHPDGNRLAIAKSEGGSMAAPAGIVIMETHDGVEPQHLAHFG